MLLVGMYCHIVVTGYEFGCFSYGQTFQECMLPEETYD